MVARFSDSLLGAYGGACTAIARAEERLALCMRPEILIFRLRMSELEALGTLEGELILPDLLALEYGQGKARSSVGDATVVRELAQYCRQTIQC